MARYEIRVDDDDREECPDAPWTLTVGGYAGGGFVGTSVPDALRKLADEWAKYEALTGKPLPTD